MARAPTPEENGEALVRVLDALDQTRKAYKQAAYRRCQEAGEARGDHPDVLPYGMSFGGLFGPP